MFDFCHSKNSSDNMKKKINFISIIIFLKKKKKKSSLTNMKQMCNKENKIRLQKLMKCRL